MSELTIKDKLIKQIDSLSPELQKELLDFACKLAHPKGMPGKELITLAGTISLEDLEEISKAIEDGCERVDINEW